jgi:hypothetical protein
MQHPETDRALHGAIGGMLAGVIVIVWFFIMDMVAGHPFDTPARLSSAVLRSEFTRPWPRLIAMYTILHFGVFMSLGIVTTWGLETLRLKPGLTTGVLFGVLVLNSIHYMGLLVTGTNLLTVVPIAQVSLANLCGAMLMMAYLKRASAAQVGGGWNPLERNELVYRGLVTGLFGGAIVAVWFLAADMVSSAPLHTASALGSAVLLGAAGPDEVQLNFGVITAYSVLHLMAFSVIGVGFAWLAHRVEGRPDFGLRAFGLFLLIEGLFLGTLGMTSGWIVQELGWLTILVSNALAVLGMAMWLWRSRPKLREAIQQ